MASAWIEVSTRSTAVASGWNDGGLLMMTSAWIEAHPAVASGWNDGGSLVSLAWIDASTCMASGWIGAGSLMSSA